MKKLIKSIMILLTGLASLSSVQANDLINYLGYQPELTKDQAHYFQTESENPIHENIQFATINMNVFSQNTITLEVDNYTYTFEKEERGRIFDANRKSWIGKIPGSFADYAHFVINKSEQIVVGHITIDGWKHVIRPLSGGLHIVASVNDALAPGCGITKKHSDNSPTIDDKPLITDHPDVSYEVNNEDSRGTGECAIRVLVVYTDDADAAVADILSDINNAVNLANTGYNNSFTLTRIELAACYREVYAEVDLDTGLDDITFSGGSNSEFDDVFTQQTLWDADQVALIMSGGGGLAWLNISANRQFSVTGQNNFSVFTFHHELGHNALCTHDLVNTDQPGTAPYAGWGEPTTGCFRTVLAYSAACGTGSCSRHNIFSDDNFTYSCGGSSYARGSASNRNQDRLQLSDHVINGYQTVSAISIYGGDYNWFSGESVHRAANNEVGYSSATNNFELFSGSEGSFRASDEVTLGEGFWARSGCEFTAYLETCNPLPTPPDEPAPVAQNKNQEIDESSDNRIAIAPNPFSSTTNINYFIDEESTVDIKIYNVQGALLHTLLDNSTQQLGNYTLQFDGSHLSAGTYFCIIMINDEIFKKSLVISGH